MSLDALSLVRVVSAPLAAGDVKSVWFYPTADAQATVAASGYFNNATKKLCKGDVIMVAGALGGTPTLSSYVVTSATGAATVTTAISVAEAAV